MVTVLENIQRLLDRGVSPDFDITNARFKEASGGSLFGTNRDIETGASTLRIEAQLRQNALDRAEANANIQQNLRVQQRKFNDVTTENLVSLGNSVTDLSNALTQQVTNLQQSIAQTGQLAGQGILRNTDLILQNQPQGESNQPANLLKGVQDFFTTQGLGLSTGAIAAGGAILLLLLLRR